MTIIMTPDKKPFYAGTYFPKTNRWGRPGLMELLPKIASLSEENFLDMLGEFSIPAVNYPAEDLETELEDLG